MTPSRFATALYEYRASGRELLDLSESNPTHCGLRYNTDAMLAALANPAALQYTPDPHGLSVAREAVAAYYGRRGGADVPINNIFLTTSTSEGYSFLFRLLCDPGDEVLVPTPSYPLFEYLGVLNDVRLVPYSLVYDHGWQIDLHTIERALSSRTRALMLVHPNNPTGSFVKAEEADAIAAICARAGAALVADEVFLDYAHDGAPRQTFATESAALCFTLSGLSKIAGLPQMKGAWVVASGPADAVADATARLEVIADTYLSMNAPIQHAFATMLREGGSIRDQLLEVVRQNLRELDAQLTAQALVARLEVEGGWYAVLRVPATRSDEQLAIELVEQQGVLVHPGHFYDFHGEGFLVVSLITPVASFTEGIARLVQFFR